MNEFLEQFLIESRELVEQASADLLVLEQHPTDRARLDGAFRAFHTLKGAAAIVDFAAMAHATHATEDVLAAVRSGARHVTPALIDDCLACLDQITRWLEAMAVSGEVPEDAQPAADALARQATTQAATQATGEAAKPSILPDYAIDVLREQMALVALPPDAGYAGRLAAASSVIGNVLRRFGVTGEADIAAIMAGLPANAAPALPAMDAPARKEPVSATPRASRRDDDRLDAIVKLAGELTVTKNALGHALQAATDDPLVPRLQKLHAQLDRQTSDLLRQALATRVLPLRQVLQRFPRLVREMAASLDRPVRLIIEGDATEADKAVVEALFEPILHTLRNAVDHGVEPAAQREAAGKPPVAIITLRAWREGDQVVIEIADDGAGINISAIRAAAAARDVATREALANLPDEAVLDLIFTPGFSTRQKVTDLSGRGVGMDAVRTGIARLGGQVSVQSRPGQGTTLRFTLPYTVMMARVLTVQAGGQMFGIPFESVVETVQIPRARIVALGAASAILLRGRTVPLIGLAGALGLAEDTAAAIIHAVVVQNGAEWGAWQVERFGGQFEVMLKPIEGLLSGTPGIAGTTLLGDGTVLIVLELQALMA
jgi:two-component system chemotaxis sensor kinase CheA